MPHITKESLNSLDGNARYFNSKGNHECVALVQGTSTVPMTKFWRMGKKVLDCSAKEISPGTIIATFDETGKYPKTQGHAAIYESHTRETINVIDQWNAQGIARRRTIRSKKSASRDVNDSNWYYIVE